MRVLLISGLTAFGIGGAQTELLRLAGGLRGRDCQIGLVLDRQPAELADAPYFKLDYPPGSAAAEQIGAAVAAFSPHCIHVAGGGIGLLHSLESLKLATPWLFTTHNLPPFERIFPALHGHDRLHYLLRNARAWPSTLAWKRFLSRAAFATTIAHSRRVADHLRDYGCPTGKIAMIPLGCDELLAQSSQAPAGAAAVFPADSGPRLLTVAGIAHHKGLHDALDAIALLRPTHPRIAYRIIGQVRDASYLRYLQHKIDRLSLGETAAILRSAPEEQRLTALQQADLYLQPSHEEGFCLAFIEAAVQVGRLLGCDAGAIAEIANGDSSSAVVPAGDPAALAQAAAALLAGPAPASLHARRARLAAAYSWGNYLTAHLSLYSTTTIAGHI